MTPPVFFAVSHGHQPGIYSNHSEYDKQLKGFSGARSKKFKSLDKAVTFLRQGQVAEHIIQESVARYKPQVIPQTTDGPFLPPLPPPPIPDNVSLLHKPNLLDRPNTSVCEGPKNLTISSNSLNINLPQANLSNTSACQSQKNLSSSNSYNFSIPKPKLQNDSQKRPVNTSHSTREFGQVESRRVQEKASQHEISSEESNSNNSSFTTLIRKCTSSDDHIIDFCSLASMIRNVEVDWRPMILKLRRTELVNGKLSKRTKWSNSPAGKDSLSSSANANQESSADPKDTDQSTVTDTQPTISSTLSNSSPTKLDTPGYLGFKQSISQETQLNTSSNLNLSQALNAKPRRYNSCWGKFYTFNSVQSDGYEYERDGSVVVYLCTKGFGVYWSAGHEDNISLPPTTNNYNQSDIWAAIKAIEQAAKRGTRKITIRTSNCYLVKAATDWLQQWLGNGWKDPNGSEVKNRLVFDQLISAMSLMEKVTWQQVHSGQLRTMGNGQNYRSKNLPSSSNLYNKHFDKR